MSHILESMHASESIKNYIGRFEGSRLIAYQDERGIWTIGKGSLDMPDGRPVKKGDTITESEEKYLFDNDILFAEDSVKNIVKVSLNSHQFDALLSFTFNIGESKVSRSTLLKKLNNCDYVGAGLEFLRWNKVYIPKKGAYVISTGLNIRRKKEFEIWSTPVDNKIPVGYLDHVIVKGLVLVKSTCKMSDFLDPDS